MTEGRATRLLVDLDQIGANARLLSAWAPGSCRVMAVVKANAYGHGDLPVAKAALANGCRGLGVALVQEGVGLRQGGVMAPILVMGAPERESVGLGVTHGLLQTVFLPEHLAWISQEAARQQRMAGLHIKIDTGMGRIGIQNAQVLAELVAAIARDPWLRLEGAFTHMANAEVLGDPYALAQLQKFEALTSSLPRDRAGFALHAANSAAFLAYPQAAYDWARVGLALYGVPPVKNPLPLQEALRWVTQASFVKTVEKGQSIGYGRSYIAPRDMRVMTLPVGYGDGYFRGFSGKGSVLVRGQRAALVGRICMDQSMADVSHIPGVRMGDEVVLLGKQQDQRISSEEMAQWIDTIPYEIMCAIGARVPRIYIGGEGPA